MYIATNLQDNPTLPHCARAMISTIRTEATGQVLRVCLNESSAPPHTYRLLHKELSRLDAKNVGKTPKDVLTDALKDFFKHSKEEYAKVMKVRLQKAIQQQLKQQEQIAGIWRELVKLDDAVLIRKISHPDPVVSLLAIQVAGKKRLPVEKECITLLKSVNPSIRQAARQTLVRLGRSVDFGPDPAATPQQIAAAVRSWSNWAAIQTDEPVEEMEPAEKK